MRLVFKFGLVPKSSPVNIAASGEETGGRFFSGSLDLRSVIAVAGLALTLVAMRVDTSSKLAAGEVERAQLRSDVDRLQHEIRGKVERTEYSRDTQRLDLVLGGLVQSQQQMYQAMIQQRAQERP